jgi:hypothetical protein
MRTLRRTRGEQEQVNVFWERPYTGPVIGAKPCVMVLQLAVYTEHAARGCRAPSTHAIDISPLASLHHTYFCPQGEMSLAIDSHKAAIRSLP